MLAVPADLEISVKVVLLVMSQPHNTTPCHLQRPDVCLFRVRRGGIDLVFNSRVVAVDAGQVTVVNKYALTSISIRTA